MSDASNTKEKLMDGEKTVPDAAPTESAQKPADAELAVGASSQAVSTESKPTEKTKRKPRVATAKVAGPDFTVLDATALAVAYNEMVLTAVDLGMKKVSEIKEFGSQKIGIQACERLHAAITKTRSSIGSAEGGPDKKESTTVARKTPKKSNKSRTAKKTAGARRPRMAFAEGAKIEKLKDNPYRPGTGRHKRTEKALSFKGRAVETALENKVSRGTLTKLVKDKVIKVA